MKKTMNEGRLRGRLGNDPTVVAFQDGTIKLVLSVATDEGYYDKDKKWVSIPEWHRVTVRGDMATELNGNLHKGDTVVVAGRMKTEKWRSNGQDVEVKVIQAWQLDKVAEATKQADTKAQAPSPARTYTRPAPQPVAQDFGYPEDLPF